MPGDATEVLVTPGGIEFSVHACPKILRREIKAIFPNVEVEDILIVPTCQRARMDLTARGDEVEAEKDRLLERFAAVAEASCAMLTAEGLWSDWADPCSGLPMRHRDTNVTYDEVSGLATLRGFRLSGAGGCRVVLHPSWGARVYPATLFAKAPRERVVRAVMEADGEEGGRIDA